MVIRENFASSVVPTVRLSILYPRLANKPDIRLRTPKLFSTSNDKQVFFSISLPLYSNEIRMDLTLDQCWSLVLNGFRHDFFKVCIIIHFKSFDTIGFGKLHKILSLIHI